MKTLSTFICFVAAITLHAQEFNSVLYEPGQFAQMGISASPQLNVQLGYATSFKNIQLKKHPVTFVSYVNLPLFSQQRLDIDLHVGAGSLFMFTKKFKMISGFSADVYRTENLNGRFVNSGFRLQLLPGYYGDTWIFAAHIVFDYRPWVNLKHSDYAKQAFQDLYSPNDVRYTSPHNGWHYQSYTTLQSGISVTRKQKLWSISFTAGYLQNFNKVGVSMLTDIGIMPFYGGLSVGRNL
jgi:hypothetical protein